MAAADDPVLTVTVSFSPRAGEVDEAVVRLLPGATAGDAILASGIAHRHSVIAVEPGAEPVPIGIWGERCGLTRALRDGDRVELYRPLSVDPKEARRQRYRAKSGVKSATSRASGKTKTGTVAEAAATITLQQAGLGPRQPPALVDDQANPSR